MAEEFSKVQDLRPSATGLNLRVKVVDCKTVVDRPKLTVVEAIVGDETATVVFAARNEHAALVKKGAGLELKGARVDMYRGSMRLAVGAGGGVEAAAGAEGIKAKEDNNLSLIEFELVPVP